MTLSDTASDEDDETASEEEDTQPGPSTEKATAQSPVAANTGLAGLNRAQMERERLERLKRARTTSENEPQAKRLCAEKSSGKTRIESSPRLPEASTEPSDGKFQYPDGTIKWTHALGFSKESHHITIEEVLQKDTLKAAVLSGFQVPQYSFFG